MKLRSALEALILAQAKGSEKFRLLVDAVWRGQYWTDGDVKLYVVNMRQGNKVSLDG